MSIVTNIMHRGHRGTRLSGTARFWVYEGEIEKVEALRVPDDGPFYRENGKIYVPRQSVLDSSDWTKNLIVTVGKDLLLNRLFGIPTIPNAIDATNGNMGAGTEATAAGAGDTKLNPAGGGTVFLKVFDATFPSRAAEVVTTQTTYATGEANFNWQECGLFNGPTNGTSTLFDRIAPIGAFNKTSAVSIVLQIKVTQA